MSDTRMLYLYVFISHNCNTYFVWSCSRIS